MRRGADKGLEDEPKVRTRYAQGSRGRPDGPWPKGDGTQFTGVKVTSNGDEKVTVVEAERTLALSKAVE